MTSTVPDQAGPQDAAPELDASGLAAPERAAPHQAIYRAWRAQTFAGIVGQEATVAALRNAVRTERVAHALLFVGPRGTGKTSMARIVAKALNCTDLRDGEPCDRCAACVAIREGNSLDVAEMDAASNNKVDDMRELLPRIATGPSDLRRKVFIIDEVQRIKEGWDVLLKTLEEPPDHVAFIFCTTDAGQIRPAILSRVQRYDFRKLTVDQIAGKLRRILAEIGREADDDAIDLIARAAAGGMRDAESMLDQLLSGATDRLTADRVRDTLGLASAEAVDGFLDALLGGEPLAGLAILDGLDERGRDARTFLDQVMELVRARLVAALGADARSGPGAARLIAIGRRLAAIDPARLGPGGLRFQLELVALEVPPTGDRAATEPPAVPVEPARAAPVEPAVADHPAATLAAPAPTPHRGQRALEPAEPAAPAEPGAPLPAPTSATSPLPAPEPAPPPPDSASAEPGPPEPAPPPAATAPSPALEPPAEPVAASPSAPASGVPDDAGSAEATDDLAGLLARWLDVIREVSRNPAIKPIIIEARPISFEGSTVTLGFPESKPFMRDHAERKRSAIEEGIAQVVGRAVAIRFTVTNLDSYPPLGEGADAERLLSEARRIFADDLADVGEVS